MIDTHAHCQFNAYKSDMDEVIRHSLEKNTKINLIGTLKETSKYAVEVAEKYEGVYASIGLHPEHLFSDHLDENETSFMSREDDFDYGFYSKLAENPKVIGIGECGLDLYRIPEGMSLDEILPKQREVFLKQIHLAKEYKLPLVVHSRDAHTYLIEILSSADARGVTGTMHCYTSNWQNAKKYLDIGLYLGFTGVITFPPKKSDPKAQEELLEVVKKMPEDRILLETDCPYLGPVPFRGKRGEPWMVDAIAEKIAELRGVSKERIVESTDRNAQALFTKMR